MKLHDFRVLTFDCYGTLIDWESGIFAALQPLLQRCAPPPARNAALEAFARHESAVEQASPRMLYSDVLAEVHRRLAREWNAPMTDAEHARFGASVPDWPAFPDSAQALAYLKRHYKLVILSNVHRAGFEASNRRLGVTFDAIYTAQSLFHDHAPAKRFGLASAWIDRRHDQSGGGATMPAPAGTAYDFRFPTLQAMADAHQGGG